MNIFKKTKDIQKEIPIFFATDDNYLPYLDVTIRSLKVNADRSYHYVINVINTGLREEGMAKVKVLEDDNFTINFCDISAHIEPIRQKLKNLYHFSFAAWYRLFIQSLFPQYDKALYLDCDIIVLGDIAKLYNIDMGDNLVAAARCGIVECDPTFSEYAEKYCGTPRNEYLQSGILVMNLKEFRKRDVENKFCYLINKYDFDVIDPDQAYLNVMCKGAIKFLPNGWNKEAIPTPLEGDLNIVHYALYKKPWQYDDVLNKEYFWKFAEESLFYADILNTKDSFTDEMREKKEKANIGIVEHAKKLINSENSFVNLVIKGDPDWFSKLVVEA